MRVLIFSSIARNPSIASSFRPSSACDIATTYVDGIEIARVHRPGSTDRDLARGPGRLCKALGIHRADNGLDLRDVLVPGLVPTDISTGPRVGLRKAAERPWRFWITGDPTVSRYVAAKPRARRTGSGPPAGPGSQP